MKKVAPNGEVGWTRSRGVLHREDAPSLIASRGESSWWEAGEVFRSLSPGGIRFKSLRHPKKTG
jgi:hypothetical protein